MSMPTLDPQKLEWFLNHGIEEVLPSKEALRTKLLSGDRIRVYLGVDPSGPTMHIGHAIALQKLAELQELGHEVILLLGDFTAMIGDPTDKLATRKQLTREQVQENLVAYKEQAGRFMKFDGPNAVQIKFNNDWLGKMSFADVIELAAHFTVQQMVERDMFENRIKEGKPVHLHEFLYPLMQGYDSVAMEVDGEIGGNDQTFNMLAGRTLLREVKNKEKFVITNKLLADPSGKKMGKTEGNMIAMTDSPEDMYGKLMSWPDEMIVPGFELCTDLSAAEIHDIKTAIKEGANPMAFKKDLARSIVIWLAGEEASERAAVAFATVHQKGEKPEEIAELKVSKEISLVDALIESKLCTSKSDARRQVEQGGVKVDDVVVKDPAAMIGKGSIVQKGKRHFVELV